MTAYLKLFTNQWSKSRIETKDDAFERKNLIKYFLWFCNRNKSELNTLQRCDANYGDSCGETAIPKKKLVYIKIYVLTSNLQKVVLSIIFWNGFLRRFMFILFVTSIEHSILVFLGLN